MNIAISNIGWHTEEEADVAKTLQELGVKYVEIAPTKVWEDPTNVSDEQIAAYTAFWKQYGITIVAFQSMLFGKNDLTVFDDAETRVKTIACLNAFIELAGRMQAKVLVFGSPKNRHTPDGMNTEEATAIAKDFFGKLGLVATANHTTFCIEPNAPFYQCNFVTTAAEGQKLVEAVNNPGFGLHLDSANMTMAGDDPTSSIVNAKNVLRHFHISARNLGDIEDTDVPHQKMADALRSIGYQGFASIEMRPNEPGKNARRVRNAVAIAQKYYG